MRHMILILNLIPAIFSKTNKETVENSQRPIDLKAWMGENIHQMKTNFYHKT